MKKLLFTCFCLVAIQVSAQVTISRQVLGSMGHTVSLPGGIELSATVGEPVVHTAVSGQYALSQGFHQPGIIGNIEFDVVTFNASCPTSTDGFAELENLSGCRPPYTITWSMGEEGTAANRLSPGSYAVTVQAGLCSLTKEFTISAGPESECQLRFFKAFSPNGDGKNDRWTIENINRPEFADSEVEIFNRWGQTVWSGEGYNNEDRSWSGKGKNGNELPDGTYFFVAKISGVTYKGYIELTR